MAEISFKDRLIKVWKEQRPDIKSQRELERILKLSNGSIQKWNESKPNQSTLEKISKGLHVSVDYLLGNEDENVATPSSDKIQDIDALGGLFRKYGEKNENLSPSEAKKYQQDLVNYAEYRAEQIRKAREKKNRES